jgi:hypothetical protein
MHHPSNDAADIVRNAMVDAVPILSEGALMTICYHIRTVLGKKWNSNNPHHSLQRTVDKIKKNEVQKLEPHTTMEKQEAIAEFGRLLRSDLEKLYVLPRLQHTETALQSVL